VRRADPPSSRETLLLICGLVALTQASWGLAIPVLPVYARQFGASAAQLGVVISAFSVARLLVNIPAGLIADRMDRRLLVVSAVTGVGVVLACTSLANSLAMLIGLRLLLGLAGGVAITVGQSLLADLTEGGGRGQAMATLQAFQLAGGSLGPALGGVTAGLFGPRASFVLAGSVCLTVACWAAMRLPRRAARVAVDPQSATPIRSLFGDRSFLASAGIGFTLFFVRFGGQQTLVALIAYTWVGLSTTVYGIALGAMTVLNLSMLRPVGRLSDRSRKVPIAGSLVATGVGYLGFSQAHDTWIFFVALAVVGLANGFSGSVPAAYCADVLPPDRRGAGIGIYRSFGDLGGLIGPVAVGLTVDRFGLSVASLGTAALVTLAAGLFWLLARETVGRRATWQGSQALAVLNVDELKEAVPYGR
jgi:MFS family permease